MRKNCNDENVGYIGKYNSSIRDKSPHGELFPVQIMVKESKQSIIPVGTLEELKQKGCLSVIGQEHDIVLFYHREKV